MTPLKMVTFQCHLHADHLNYPLHTGSVLCLPYLAFLSATFQTPTFMDLSNITRDQSFTSTPIIVSLCVSVCLSVCARICKYVCMYMWMWVCVFVNCLHILVPQFLSLHIQTITGRIMNASALQCCSIRRKSREGKLDTYHMCIKFCV